jgi:hypothetical protein
MIARIHARTWSTQAFVVIGLLLAGCGASGGTSPAGSTAPTESVGTPIVNASRVEASQPSASLRPIAIPRPTDLPTDGTCRDNHPCLGLLAAGSHHTQYFSPGFAFTIASGAWENLADEGGAFHIVSIDRPDDAIAFFRQPWPTKPTGVRAPGVASTVTAITKWLATNSALEATEPQPVTIGGLRGTQIDLALAPGAENADPSCPVQVCVNLFIGRSSTWAWDWGFAGPERQRLYLLEAPDTVVAIFADSLDGTTFDAIIADADKILGTVKFDPS